MTTTNWLPRILCWVFRVFTIFMGIGVIAVLTVLLIDPKLPTGMLNGRLNFDMMGLPGSLLLQNTVLTADLVNGGLKVRVDDAAGLFEVVKHRGLPVGLISLAYFGVLFDLLRRLFRNVERGESFTRQTLRLVQIIGFSLLAFSMVSAFAENFFVFSLFDYLAHHAVVMVSGVPVPLTQPENFSIDIGTPSPFGSPLFFSGLMVLALSEVFRQGLLLKTDSELTI